MLFESITGSGRARYVERAAAALGAERRRARDVRLRRPPGLTLDRPAGCRGVRRCYHREVRSAGLLPGRQGAHTLDVTTAQRARLVVAMGLLNLILATVALTAGVVAPPSPDGDIAAGPAPVPRPPRRPPASAPVESVDTGSGGDPDASQPPAIGVAEPPPGGQLRSRRAVPPTALPSSEPPDRADRLDARSATPTGPIVAGRADPDAAGRRAKADPPSQPPGRPRGRPRSPDRSPDRHADRRAPTATPKPVSDNDKDKKAKHRPPCPEPGKDRPVIARATSPETGRAREAATASTKGARGS